MAINISKNTWVIPLSGIHPAWRLRFRLRSSRAVVKISENGDFVAHEGLDGGGYFVSHMVTGRGLHPVAMSKTDARSLCKACAQVRPRFRSIESPEYAEAAPKLKALIQEARHGG